MFILITMACNISPIIIFAIRSFYKRHYKFKYELITNFTLALATVSSACLVIFFNFFTQVAWMGVPYVFLVLLFILASFQSMSRILVIGFLGHLKRQAVSTFIIGQGEYQGILWWTLIKLVTRSNCLFSSSLSPLHWVCWLLPLQLSSFNGHSSDLTSWPAVVKLISDWIFFSFRLAWIFFDPYSIDSTLDHCDFRYVQVAKFNWPI